MYLLPVPSEAKGVHATVKDIVDQVVVSVCAGKNREVKKYQGQSGTVRDSHKESETARNSQEQS